MTPPAGPPQGRANKTPEQAQPANRLMRGWRTRLAHRSRRERLGLTTAAVAVLFALTYVLLWQPLDLARQRLASRVPIWEATVAQMRLQAAEMSGLQAQTGRRDKLDAAALVARARAAGLALGVAPGEPLTPERLAFHVSSAPFPLLLSFLEGLRMEQGWQITQLRLARVPPQFIHADVVLERP